jgi:polygalacturonase
MIVLDNLTTAMTGHQPHPGTDFDGMGRPAKRILVEEVVKGCGIEHVEVVNPNNIKETTQAFKRALEFKGPAVVVSISPCILLENRDKRARGEKIFFYGIEDIVTENIIWRIFSSIKRLTPNFVQFYRCRNVLVENVHVRRSPMWEIHPVLCTNVIVRVWTLFRTARTTTAATLSPAGTS